MKPEQIEELKKLSGAATPGPWRPCGASDSRCQCGIVHSIAYDVPVLAAYGEEEEFHIPEDQRVANQHFVAEARSALPTLLREREQLIGVLAMFLSRHDAAHSSDEFCETWCEVAAHARNTIFKAES